MIHPDADIRVKTKEDARYSDHSFATMPDLIDRHVTTSLPLIVVITAFLPAKSMQARHAADDEWAKTLIFSIIALFSSNKSILRDYSVIIPLKRKMETYIINKKKWSHMEALLPTVGAALYP